MAATMKALAKVESKKGLRLIEVPIPQPRPNEVLIRVKTTSICGTDVHIYNWDAWSQGRIKPPVILGHEFAGEIVEVGSHATQWKVGDYVSAEGHLVDWECAVCRKGSPHLCENVSVIGIDRDGAFAEYVTIPATNVWRNPDTMRPEIATLQDPFGNAVHTAFAFPLAGKTVLITGAGPIGLMTIPLAKLSGAERVIVSEISAPKRLMAKRMGADFVIDPLEHDLVSTVKDLTGGTGTDVLLEMSGAVAAIRQGLNSVSAGGEVALLGVANPFEVDWTNLIVFKGITIKAIYGRKIWETWHRMRALLETSVVDLTPLITHDLSLEDFERGFALMMSQTEIVGKVILRP